MDYKLMKAICFFDLPVETAEDRRNYSQFRKNLIKEGFIMVQYSVYARTCPSREFADRLLVRVQKFTPPSGNVRILMITEKQYQDMRVLVGSRSNAELALGTERLVIL